MNQSSKFYPALNGIRGLAAILVFFSHASQRNVFPDVFGRGAGHMGVMLFFTLSAFLMTIIYLDKTPDRVARRNFWAARFARIYPLHFLLLTLGLIAFYLQADPDLIPYALNMRKYLSNIFFIGRFNVFWTISTEFQFYLIFGIAWILGHRIGKPILFMTVLSLVGACFVFLDIYKYPSGPVNKTIQFFSIGILAGLLIKNDLLVYYKRYFDPILICLLILFIASLPMPFEKITGFAHSGFWSPWLLILCFGIILTGALSIGPMSKLLGSRIGMELGNLSFAIYLTHVPFLHFVNYYLGTYNWPIRFGLAFVLTLVISKIIYHGFECPSRKFLRAKLSAKEE